ncbi:MAG TPA: hemin uptake protein HemP [Terriglobales bacterium]|jgi:hemin uptake protein HemP|nr:hemin uptake protein HemP [Terriglobales bacterium]
MREVIVHCASKGAATPQTEISVGKKPRIESAELFDGKSEVVIVHQNEEYNLRITRNGKLILTK